MPIIYQFLISRKPSQSNKMGRDSGNNGWAGCWCGRSVYLLVWTECLSAGHPILGSGDATVAVQLAQPNVRCTEVYCWCLDGQGNEILRTRQYLSEPDCRPYLEVTTTVIPMRVTEQAHVKVTGKRDNANSDRSLKLSY